ncbi:hypothetical protein NDU88_001908 [Pleurodeles waltl]|uniref:Uncharacterized protein n=1 Tax=Pleurodeles waltl TaxID=8319 RepID=A0AAV7LIU7_PLEWA|nr:hypothetical protein NDU88_001908 [Pleurodeles waltl]
MRGAVLPHHHIRLRAGVKEDLRMWIEFLKDFNGVTMLVDDEDWFWQIQIFSDASGAHGFGLFWDGHWASEAWPARTDRVSHAVQRGRDQTGVQEVQRLRGSQRGKRNTVWASSAVAAVSEGAGLPVKLTQAQRDTAAIVRPALVVGGGRKGLALKKTALRQCPCGGLCWFPPFRNRAVSGEQERLQIYRRSWRTNSEDTSDRINDLLKGIPTHAERALSAGF